MLSGGFISELSFISLAYGLLHVSNEIENDKCEDVGATKRGADYKVSKQLNRRIDTLKTELLEFMAKYAEHSDRIRSRNERLFRLALSKVHNSIQLDYLACWVLYLRFQPTERNKPLHDDFKWICDKEGQLMGIIDLLSQTACASKDGEMYEIANNLVREL